RQSRSSLLRAVSRPLPPTPFPYTTLFRSHGAQPLAPRHTAAQRQRPTPGQVEDEHLGERAGVVQVAHERPPAFRRREPANPCRGDRKSTRLNSSHVSISYAVFCLKKKTPP